MIMFFDTETTGLPLNWRASMLDVDNWPRVIQLAWLITDKKGNELLHWDSFIKPDGWVVPDGSDGKDASFWVSRNYTTERCLQEGVPIRQGLDGMVTGLQECPYLVSHNMDYDYNVLGAEMIRAGVRSPTRPTRICTKEASTDYCKIPHAGRRVYPGSKPQSWKWPKLDELHRHLFDTDFANAHDALGDVRALKACFFELVKRGVIKLPAEDIMTTNA